MRPSLDRTVSMQQKVMEENQQGGEEHSWTCDTSKVEEMNSLFTYKNSDNTLCQSHYNSFGHNQETPQVKNISLYQNHGFVQGNQQLHSIDMSSSSSSPAPMFSLEYPYNQSQPFLPPKVSFSSLFNSSFMNPFDSSFDFVCDPNNGYPEPLQDMHNLKPSRVIRESGSGLPQISNFSPNTASFDIQAANQLLPLSTHSSRVIPFSPSDLQSFEFVNRESQFVSRDNLLKPLEKLPQVDNKEATIFQRRMAHLQNSGIKIGDPIKESGGSSSYKGKMPMEEVQQSSRKSDDDESCMNSIDGSGSLVHDLIEQTRDQSDNNLEGNSEYAVHSLKNMGMIIGDNHKGKRKGPPAKNLMAERRRRKKLNDRLYTLRSIVPNISKMDRASILSDAIEYVKMLVQRIDDLRKELETIPVGHSPQPSASLDQLMKIPSIREDHCPSKLPGPVNQRINVEVKANEGRSVNVHMYSPIRPGLLLYTMRALENIGLDVQQAVISCLNGFTLDVFHAEQSKEGPDIPPEQIRAILLDAAAAHNLMPFNQV